MSTRLQNSRLLMLTFGTVGQLVLQTVLQIVAARFYGTSVQMDAMTAAVIIPLALTGMISLPLSAVLIPQLNQLSASSGDEMTSKRAMSFVIQIVVMLGITCTALMIVFAQSIVSLLYADLEQPLLQETARQLQIVSWMLPANLLIGLTQNLAHWKSQFVAPVIGSLLGPLCTVVMVSVLAPDWGVDALSWGLVAGAWLGAMLQLVSVIPLLGRPHASWGWLKHLCVMAFPLLLGMLALRCEPLIDRSLSSSLEQGTLSQLGYASRIVMSLCSLSSGGISTLAFPVLSAAAADRSQLQRVISGAMQQLVYLLMPVVVAVGWFHQQIVADLLERGEFHPSDTNVVSLLLVCSLGVIVGAGVGELASKVLYSLHQTRWPVLISTPLLIAGFITKAFVVEPFGVSSLAVVSSAVYLVSACLQCAVLQWYFGVNMTRGLGKAVGISLLASVPSVVIGEGLIAAGIPLPAVWGGVAGVTAYCCCLWVILRNRTPSESSIQQ